MNHIKGMVIRGVLAKITTDLAIGIDRQWYLDTFDQQWEELPEKVQEWYGKLAEFAYMVCSGTIPHERSL